MDDDLEEIKLEADHRGSAKRIRAGKKHAIRVWQQKPKWKRQLRAYRAGKTSWKNK